MRWQFHVRDEEECWMAIYKAEREREGEADRWRQNPKSNIKLQIVQSSVKKTATVRSEE